MNFIATLPKAVIITLTLNAVSYTHLDVYKRQAWDRERALERLTQVSLPPAAVAAGVSPQMQTDWSPAGQIYFFTLHTTNPAYDVMELKSIEDWVVEKNFKSVPNIVDRCV